MRPVCLVALFALVIPALLCVVLVEYASADAIDTPPGSSVSQGQTVCAKHGGFASLGAFGSPHDVGINNPLSNQRPGATSWMFPNPSGSTTGGNNNKICGGGNIPTAFEP
jgi:hypothetical protein